MSLINGDNIIGITSVYTHIYNAIHDMNNLIRKEHAEILIGLYNQFKTTILQGLIGKRLSDIHSIFWQGIITHMMISLESHPIIGLIKRDLIIETVSIVIRNDLVMNDQDKVFIETEFRKLGPQVIDILVFASKNLNHKKKKKYKLF